MQPPIGAADAMVTIMLLTNDWVGSIGVFKPDADPSSTNRLDHRVGVQPDSIGLFSDGNFHVDGKKICTFQNFFLPSDQGNPGRGAIIRLEYITASQVLEFTLMNATTKKPGVDRHWQMHDTPVDPLDRWSYSYPTKRDLKGYCFAVGGHRNDHEYEIIAVRVCLHHCCAPSLLPRMVNMLGVCCTQARSDGWKLPPIYRG